MPGTPTNRRQSTRQRLLRAATLLLAATFALPSCITSALWEAPRDKELEQWGSPDFVAHKARAPHGRPFSLLAAAPESLRSQLADPPSEGRNWLRIEPIDPSERASAQLLVQMLQEHDRPASPSRETRLHDLRLDWNAAEPSVLRANLWFDSDSDLFPALRELPGTHRTNYVLPWYEFEAMCRVEWVERPMADFLGPPLHGLVLVQVEQVPYGGALWGNIALTPLALLGDVVLSPFELVFWLAN